MSFHIRLTAWLERLFAPRDRVSGLPRLGYMPISFTTQAAHVGTPAPDRSPSPSRGARALPRISRLYEAFDTSVPVIERSGLAGRSRELRRLLGNVIEQHRHAVVYGERGSGKTSLARVFADVAVADGVTVLYDIVSGDCNFTQLIRPLLADFLQERGGSLRPEDIAPLETQDFDARRVAGLWADRLDGLTVIILDEFDQVRSLDTKREVAVLMKLLSDMRAPVRIVTVGIASDLADLITGHPSMRRHIVAVPVGTIDAQEVNKLLDRCVSNAGMTISDDAAALLVEAGRGSPFHLRLFGLHAALEAHSGNSLMIERSHVLKGFAQSFRDWHEMDDRGPDVVRRIAGASLPVQEAAYVAIARSAAQQPLYEGVVAAHLETQGWSKVDAQKAAVASLIALEPILMPSAAGERRNLADTLAPHFLLLIERGLITQSVVSADENETSASNDPVIKVQS